VRDVKPGEPAKASIEIHLHSLQQLFHSLDPSPFRDRDLDEDAAQFILESLQDLPERTEPELILRLEQGRPGTPNERPMQAIDPSHVQEAVQHYFTLCKRSVQRELRDLLRHGQRALVFGLVVVTLTIGLIEFLRAQFEAGTIASGILESLVIVSWVVLWRPAEILLYDWMPLRRRIKRYARLERMPVRIVHDERQA
jgi:hypothetical protein